MYHKPLHLSMVLVTVFLTVCESSGTQHPLSETELLEKYTQALDATQSFVCMWESRTLMTDNIPGWGVKYANKVAYEKGEYRTDNRGRLYKKSLGWGYTGKGDPERTLENPRYGMQVEGDGFSYRNGQTLDNSDFPGQLHHVYSDTKTPKYFSGEATGSLMGYFLTDERVDKVLQQAPRLSVRPSTEVINGSACYVLEAKTRRGDFTIWLDSEHGYLPARIHFKAGRGDDIGYLGTTDIVGKGELDRTIILDNVRFEEIDGQWVPMEAENVTHNVSQGVPKKYLPFDSYSKTHFKRTSIELNPDHETLGSFLNPFEHPELDPQLKNGTKVCGDGVERVWLNGKAVADIDDMIVDELDKMALEIREDRSVDPNDAWALLEEFGSAQHRIASLICEATTSGGTADERMTSQCEFRTDGLRVAYTSTQYRDTPANSKDAGALSFVYAGERLIEFRKAALSDPGMVTVSTNQFRPKTLVSTLYRGAPLMGICPGDIRRVDHVLRESRPVQLTLTKDRIGATSCYRIEADTQYGLYRLWLDPSHDFHLIKLEKQLRPGNTVTIERYADKSFTFVMDNVTFAKNEGLWVPMEARLSMDYRSGKRPLTWRHRRTRVVLDPDHTALDSFATNNIPNGTPASRYGVTGKAAWYDNKVMTEQEVKEMQANANK